MVKDLPPGQGLGGAVGGNLIDPNLKSMVCESVQPRVHLGSHSHTVWELRGMKKHDGQRFLRFQRRSGANPSRVLCPAQSRPSAVVFALHQHASLNMVSGLDVPTDRDKLSGDSDDMERRKAQYRALPSHQATIARKKGPVHTSMKIEPLSSRDRNMAIASKVGVKDATQVRPPETERIKTDRTVEEAGDTNDDDRTILQRRKASNDPEQQADEHDTIDAIAIKASPVNEGTGGEWAEEVHDEFEVHAFLESLIEICVEEWYQPPSISSPISPLATLVSDSLFNKPPVPSTLTPPSLLCSIAYMSIHPWFDATVCQRSSEGRMELVKKCESTPWCLWEKNRRVLNRNFRPSQLFCDLQDSSAELMDSSRKKLHDTAV